MKQTFTQEQQEILRSNKNVLRCSAKHITYTEAFKKSAMAQHEEGYTPSQIFRGAGLDIAIIGKKTPKWCVQRWKRKLKASGNFTDTRGKSGKQGRKAKERIPKNEKEKMKYLEAKVAYLEKENDFLKKLRNQRLN